MKRCAVQNVITSLSVQLQWKELLTSAYPCILFPPFADEQLYNLFEQSLNIRASVSFS